MSRLLRALVALFACVAMAALATPAYADDTPPSWKITRYDATVTTDAGGTSTVAITFDFDFGFEPGHGPFVTLPTRQAVAHDPDVWRMLDVEVGEVTSPSGAPADKLVTTVSDGLVIRIGREGTRVSGVQTYTLSYTVRGLLAPNHATSGLDEFNFNVIGQGWQVPLSNVSANVTGPVPIQRVACFQGSEYDTPCAATASGSTATYRVESLRPGEGMQAVAGFPAGTFTGAEPRYEKRYHVGNMFVANPATVGSTVGLGVLAVGAVLIKSRRWRRDEVYLGLTPGVRPAPGDHVRIGPRTDDAPVTVQFTPPAGAHPGEVGVLLDTRADNVDVTATFLDLAARGHFQIVEAGKKNWRFVRRETSDPLTPPEQHLVSTLFTAGDEVTTKQLRAEKYHTLLPGTRTRLHDRVVKHLRWFKGSPQAAKAVAFLGAIGLILLGGVVAIVAGAWLGWGLIGLVPMAAGVVLLVLAPQAGRRTAEGSTVLAQAKGFELYLRTAEADQIRFEEGIDVFSRYLPYATIFGVADRWAKLFKQLAQQGRYQPTDWYVGNNLYNGVYLSSAMSNLSTALSSSMRASVASHSRATSGSSGGSGFSGGGGFGGGGGGGW